MFHTWLRNLFPQASAAAPKRTGRRRPKPQLELLEDRLQPSVFQPVGAFPPLGHDTKPAFIITFGPNGSITTVKTGQGPFDGIEDTYVGVRNQSGTPLAKIHVSSSLDIFAFDDDGLSSPPFGTPGIPGSPFGPTGYEGPGTSFSNINGAENAGDVIFKGGLPSGFQAFFSLEEAPNSINVTPGTTRLNLSADVFFHYRPSVVRPSNNVIGFVVVTNPGADITGTITVNLNLPGVIMTPITVATPPQQLVAKGNPGSTTFLTFSGGLKHGQSVAIEVEFTYPGSLSLDGIRNMLVKTLTFTTP
jgi:hypothetical protein